MVVVASLGLHTDAKDEDDERMFVAYRRWTRSSV